MSKILLIEDEKEIVRLLKYNLEKEGHKLESAADGETGLAQARKLKPDLVILDWMLPRLDGLEICKILRKETSLPILMLSARREEMDRVLGLEMGADDYLTKPFSVRELLARVKILLRRSKTTEPSAACEKLLKVGKLVLDLERYEVSIDKKVLELSTKEFQFLKTLMEAQGRVLSREILLEQVWGFDQASEMDTRTIDQHVARLRAKLGTESHRLTTVKNIGYKFKNDRA